MYTVSPVFHINCMAWTRMWWICTVHVYFESWMSLLISTNYLCTNEHHLILTAYGMMMIMMGDDDDHNNDKNTQARTYYWNVLNVHLQFMCFIHFPDTHAVQRKNKYTVASLLFSIRSYIYVIRTYDPSHERTFTYVLLCENRLLVSATVSLRTTFTPVMFVPILNVLAREKKKVSKLQAHQPEQRPVCFAHTQKWF